MIASLWSVDIMVEDEDAENDCKNFSRCCYQIEGLCVVRFDICNYNNLTWTMAWTLSKSVRKVSEKCQKSAKKSVRKVQRNVSEKCQGVRKYQKNTRVD